MADLAACVDYWLVNIYAGTWDWGNNAAAGLEAATNITGSYVTQVEISGAGIIQVTYGNKANGRLIGAVLTMTPTDNLGSVSWDCTGDAQLVDQWLPSSCR